MKHIKTFESFLNENLDEAAKVKIKYNQIEKKAYTTQKTGIEFSVTINGKTAKGYWIPKFGDITNGVDVNELKGDNGQFQIFSSGGGYRSYPIKANLPKAEKQPKSLAFTGPYLDVSGLKNAFVDKITQAIENPSDKEQLSPEFLNYFGINLV